MAIIFLQERKRQQYLILVFIIVVLMTIGFFWFGVFQKPSIEGGIIIPSAPKKIKIDLKVFENPVLKILEPFEEIPPFPEEFGRENPFISYNEYIGRSARYSE
jgi:hypothetical protein